MLSLFYIQWAGMYIVYLLNGLKCANIISWNFIKDSQGAKKWIFFKAWQPGICKFHISYMPTVVADELSYEDVITILALISPFHSFSLSHFFSLSIRTWYQNCKQNLNLLESWEKLLKMEKQIQEIMFFQTSHVRNLLTPKLLEPKEMRMRIMLSYWLALGREAWFNL